MELICKFMVELGLCAFEKTLWKIYGGLRA